MTLIPANQLTKGSRIELITFDAEQEGVISCEVQTVDNLPDGRVSFVALYKDYPIFMIVNGNQQIDVLRLGFNIYKLKRKKKKSRSKLVC